MSPRIANYQKALRAAIALLSAIYEMVHQEKPPPAKDVLAMK